MIPSRKGEYALTPSVRKGLRQMVAKTNRTGIEYAAAFCAKDGVLRLAPHVKGTFNASPVPLGTCKSGEMIGWVHTHPRIGSASNEASVGDLSTLLFSHANSGLQGGTACVIHPDHREMRCYTIADPAEQEHLPALLRLGAFAGSETAAELKPLISRVRETRIAF